MKLQYKSIPFELKEVVNVEGGGWEVAGYASTFGGEPDAYGDVIVAGAFVESIAARKTKFLYEHMVPIGRELEIREDARGLFGRWSIVDTAHGTDAYKLIKAGVLDSLSIGYFTEDAEFREDGVRLLRKVDLYEVSCVAIPANTSAVITDVKNQGNLPFNEHSDTVRVALTEWLERVKSGLDVRARDGKEPLTEARRSELAKTSGSLREVLAEVDAIVSEPQPERVKVGLELRRRRLERLGILERTA